MEAIAEHALEPELTAATPRRLHLPGRTRLLLAVAGLLLGLFVVGSGRALWEGAKLSWLAAAGHSVPGKIVAIRTEPPAAKEEIVKGEPPRQTAIRWAAAIPTASGTQLRTGWISLADPAPLPDPERVPRRAPAVPVFHLGQPVPLRVASLLGVTVCQPWAAGPGSRILTLFLAGSLVLAVSLLLLRRLLRWAGSRGHLLRTGTAVIGTITHKRTETEDMARYFLRYGYPGGADSGREEQVSADQWREFHVGQPVTVLFDPKDPAHAGLYALIAQK